MNTFCKLSEDDSSKFVLKNINPTMLEKQYLLHDIQEQGMNELCKYMNQNNANITTNNATTTNSIVSDESLHKLTTSLEFVGISKIKAKPFETIVINDDLSLKMYITPNVEDKMLLSKGRKYCCWYCRHNVPTDWHPLGIPIKYNKENNAFECDGVFCSFNCIVAYLAEHNQYRYKDSTVLLLMMYRHIFNKHRDITKISPSPSWKLLKEYGGHLSIEEYRNCIMNSVEYKSLQQLYTHVPSLINTQMVNNSEIFVEC